MSPFRGDTILLHDVLDDHHDTLHWRTVPPIIGVSFLAANMTCGILAKICMRSPDEVFLLNLDNKLICQLRWRNFDRLPLG